MAAALKDTLVRLLISSALFFTDAACAATKNGKQFQTTFKDGEFRLLKSGKSPAIILIPSKQGDSRDAGMSERSWEDGRSARSTLAERLLEEHEVTLEGGGDTGHTRALFLGPTGLQDIKDFQDIQDIEDTAPARDLQEAAKPMYEFLYKVNDQHGNHYGHMESRSGAKTWGEYFVRLPDDRLQTVRYWADQTGFHARVSYGGQSPHDSDDEDDLNS